MSVVISTNDNHLVSKVNLALVSPPPESQFQRRPGTINPNNNDNLALQPWQEVLMAYGFPYLYINTYLYWSAQDKNNFTKLNIY